MLSGSDLSLDVFTLPASRLATASGLRLAIPPSAAAVLNITGSAAQLRGLGFSTGSTGPSQIILNFPQATAVTLSSIGISGTVLAPLAAVQLDSGEVLGQVLASSFSGTGQVNLAPPVGFA